MLGSVRYDSLMKSEANLKEVFKISVPKNEMELTHVVKNGQALLWTTLCCISLGIKPLWPKSLMSEVLWCQDLNLLV